MKFLIRPAAASDAAEISSVLTEAVEWLISQGNPMWRLESVTTESIKPSVADFYVATDSRNSAAGVMKLQAHDPEIWPDAVENESVFVHRLAVRRRFAGLGLSKLLLDFARQKAELLGKRYVRLDCASDRPKLRAIYERYGFRYHSVRDVGPFHVARYEDDLRNKKAGVA